MVGLGARTTGRQVRPVGRPQTGRVDRRRNPSLALALLAAAAVTSACSASSKPVAAPPLPAAHPSPLAPGAPPPSAPRPVAPPAGGLSEPALSALLLTPADLPDLPQRREFRSVALTTQPTPQLALCRPAAPEPAHQLANVLAKPAQMGRVDVFEVVSVFADGAAAATAFDQVEASARACPRFTQGGVPFAVEGLVAPAVPSADQTLSYRLTTPGVVGSDVRTLARAGRVLVLVTGYGVPPAGQTLQDFQTATVRRAVARVTRGLRGT